MIKVLDGFTGISVAPDETRATPAERSGQRRAATGARVTVEFSRHAPLPPHTNIRVNFDIAENGDFREICGIPQHTHTTALHAIRRAFHYRLSHWIPSAAVMQFVRAEQIVPGIETHGRVAMG